MRTFLQLQNEVLKWAADEDDEGLPRELVKQALNRTQQKLLLGSRWDFMLWPKVETLSVVSGQQQYALHPLFGQGLFFFNSELDEWMEEVPQGQLMEAKENFTLTQNGEPNRFSLTGVSRVRNQPASAGVVTVTAAGTESQANSVVIRGMLDGEVVSATLSSGTPTWTSIVSTQQFDRILNVVKVGDDWEQQITVTVGSTTILVLSASEFGRQYRQFELVKPPSMNTSVLYRFFQRPEQMELDNDLPQVPEEFDELLVLDAMLKLQGYTRATPPELSLWQNQYDEMMIQFNQTYRDARTINARPKYVELVDRL